MAVVDLLIRFAKWLHIIRKPLSPAKGDWRWYVDKYGGYVNMLEAYLARNIDLEDEPDVREKCIKVDDLAVVALRMAISRPEEAPFCLQRALSFYSDLVAYDEGRRREYGRKALWPKYQELLRIS